MTMHYPGSNQLEEQVKRILELVVQPRWPDCRMHGSCHWRMVMGLQQETVARRQHPYELHVEGIQGFKVRAAHQVCHGRHKRQRYPKNQERGNTYPLSSRKRQITFATISSFFSSGKLGLPGLSLVRAACFSVAVAPKQSAKSIVEDC